jgi:hypothetical protein
MVFTARIAQPKTEERQVNPLQPRTVSQASLTATGDVIVKSTLSCPS